MLYFRSEEDMQMKNMIKKVIKKRIEKVKLNGYNCSPCDYYRPKNQVNNSTNFWERVNVLNSNIY